MKLSDLDEAVKLRNWRAKALDLIQVADGALEVKFLYRSDMNVASIISVDCVHEAIQAQCRTMIAIWECELKALGVEP